MRAIFTVFIFLSFLIQGYGQWTTIENISSPRFFMGSASNDNYLIFAGGNVQGFQPSGNVDIYSISLCGFITETLSVPRTLPAAAATNDFIFVAGGNSLSSGDDYNTIDIFDINDGFQLISTASDTLSIARSGVSGVVVGDKVLFAGGGDIAPGFSDFQTYDVVDIYDLTNQTWDTAHLSVPRFLMGATVVGDKAYFGGGAIDNFTASNRVDIYDATLDEWTIDSLSQARIFLAATSINGMVMFAGGNDASGVSSDVVDIYDTVLGNWSTAQLSVPRMGLAASAGCDKAYFIGGGDINWANKFITNSYNTVDVYNTDLTLWTTDTMATRRAGTSAEFAGNKLVVAGGWDAQGGQLLDSAESIECVPTGIRNISIPDSEWQVFPNPVTDKRITVDLGPVSSRAQSLSVYNLLGELLIERDLSGQREINIYFNRKNFTNGIYFIRLTDHTGKQGTKKLIFNHSF